MQPNILLGNCQSLTSKKSDELLTICAKDDISVILATETWFKDTKQIQLPNYKLYTTHRTNRSGGGAAVYIKQDLPVKQLNKYTYNDDVTSATWVKVKMAHQDIITTIYHKHCPIRRLRIKTDSKPAWETPLIQKLRRAKDKAFSLGKPTYAYLRQTLELLIAKAKQRYYDNKINHLKAGTTNWWRSIKSLDPSTKSDKQSHYIIDGNLCTPDQFACKLNSYYNTIAGEPPQPTIIVPPANHQFDEISIGLVKLAVKNINAGKAVHSQDYPPWISKNCAEDLCIPITSIVNKTLQQCRYPMLYKQAEITPIPKTKSAATCKDYRPISLLWHIGKVVESFMCRKLRQQITPKLEDNQYAYKQGVGCTDALVSVLDDVTKSLDDNKNIGMQLVLYDFSKAFDLMDHSLLLSKLKSLDVSEGLIALVAHYLLDRQHCVAIRQHSVTSNYLKNNVGVPQGTLCGPVLWLAFVNSLQFQHGTTIKYADDTTTLYPLDKLQTDIISNTKVSVEFTAPQIGQQLVDQCSDWATANKMRINTQKTKTLNISLRKQLTMKNNLEIDGSVVENVTNSKLLGVTSDSHLTFSDHIADKRKSANRKIHGLLVLKQSGVDQRPLIHIYKAQIIPTLSHAAPAWFPFTTEQQRSDIEKCQKLALRIIHNEVEHYNERLAIAQLPTLCTILHNHCSIYMARLTANNDHPLRSRMTCKQSNRPKRSSSSQSDFYYAKTRTAKRSDFILTNPKYSN